MRWALVTILATALLGCAAHRSRAVRVNELNALVAPPAGWTIQRADDTPRYVQRVWVSPTGQTSYGVARFDLPLPVGNDIVLHGFLAEMRQSEGEADLISKQRDDTQDRLNFVAQGGRYRIHGIIVTRGFAGWVVYGGVLRNGPVALDELELAVQARENTRLGVGEADPNQSR